MVMVTYNSNLMPIVMVIEIFISSLLFIAFAVLVVTSKLEFTNDKFTGKKRMSIKKTVN